jgi:hypothetical protein
VAATAPMAPNPVTATPAPVEAQRDAALDIAQTFTLAGRPELIAGFLEAGLTPARVRHQLLAMQAEAAPEIASRVPPVTTAYTPAIQRPGRQPPPPGGEAPSGRPLILPRRPSCPRSSKASTWATS